MVRVCICARFGSFSFAHFCASVTFFFLLFHYIYLSVYLPFSLCADSEETRDALRAREWLNETASQLTVHGLCELQRKAGTQEVFVLFRNNHFNTVVKRTDTDALLVLATDQGLVDQPVCWETLAGVDGDSQFLTADYARVNPDAIRTSAARPGEGVQANAE